ncbi:MAG TPA: fatty acid desaturase family protein [Amycolatopsis sp.]|uniref:fatty acid desaturase family protein n=1 Tax=Amycolatopsis sp. TaxID=37632 RepID=UPI002B47FE6A|nr:fatty acid desaturase family protein [Amycolatopsis sp.]HKS45053.1 fatty acid desaturase family protein [Amycolatopsis sp.]
MSETSWAYDGKRYRMYRFADDIEDEIKELNRSDNWHAGLAWLQDVAWMALCVWLCLAVSWWLYPLAVLVIGARQRGLSTILHDCAHGVGVANRNLQMAIGTVFTAYPIFQQHYAYKISHVFTHHPKLGNPDGDPDLRFFIEQKAYEISAPRTYVRRAVLMPMLGSQTWAYLRYLVRNRYRMLKQNRARTTDSPSQVKRRKRVLDRAGFWVFWATVVGVCAAQGWLTGLLLFWVVPYLTSFQILGWYIELSEHTPLVRDSNVDLYMTRNRKSRTWEKFLTGIHNDNYHLEHHLDPRTPFWNLGKSRKVRLRDPNYAAVDRALGGLFTRGPEGQPSATSAIVESMTSLKEPHRAAA